MIDATPEFAERFLRGGGHLTLAEWLGLTPDAREAFVAAGDRIHRARVEEVVTALADAIEDAKVAEVLDLAVNQVATRLEGDG